jgi:gliding motility-associated protein GldC
MIKSQIKFDVELDKDRIPEKIEWSATDHKDGKSEPINSFSVSLWDSEQRNTLRIDLWTKKMPVDQMKQFCIDSIGGMAQTILNSTGDEYMANELKELCKKFSIHLEKEIKEGKYR